MADVKDARLVEHGQVAGGGWRAPATTATRRTRCRWPLRPWTRRLAEAVALGTRRRLPVAARAILVRPIPPGAGIAGLSALRTRRRRPLGTRSRLAKAVALGARWRLPVAAWTIFAGSFAPGTGVTGLSALRATSVGPAALGAVPCRPFIGSARAALVRTPRTLFASRRAPFLACCLGPRAAPRIRLAPALPIGLRASGRSGPLCRSAAAWPARGWSSAGMARPTGRWWLGHKDLRKASGWPRSASRKNKSAQASDDRGTEGPLAR
jgi:hypothetical protein